MTEEWKTHNQNAIRKIYRYLLKDLAHIKEVRDYDDHLEVHMERPVLDWRIPVLDWQMGELYPFVYLSHTFTIRKGP